MVGVSDLELSEDQKAFHELPIDGQVEVVVQKQGKDKLRYLFLSDNPKELVEKLPAIELFIMLKESGEKDALDLISLTTPEQLQYLLDLDFWTKDRLDPGKVLHWIGLLLECGEEKIFEFLTFSDLEFIALLLKKFLHVRRSEGESLEAVDRTFHFTLDQIYLIIFERQESRVILQPFLEYIYHWNSEAYRRLMEALIVELESELEETGYRLKKGRLADYGFPDLEEALEIYRFINPDSLKSGADLKKRETDHKSPQRDPTFHLALQQDVPFFSSVVFGITDPLEQSRLRGEMASLLNKAMIAEPMDQFSLEAIKRVGERAFHYLNLGLEYLSDKEEARGVEILRSLGLQKIFQAGVGATLLLKKRAEAILKGPWFRGEREHLAFLDHPLFEKFEGVLKRRPAYYREGTLKDFIDLRDLEEIKSFLKMVEIIAKTLGDKLNLSPADIKQLDLTGCHPKEWQSITFSSIFLTALGNQVLNGVFRFEAIGRARLKDLLSRLFVRDEAGEGVVRMEIRNGVKEWFESIESDMERRQHLLAFWDFCRDLLEGEYGKIPEEEKIDPRFVKGLLVCE